MVCFINSVRFLTIPGFLQSFIRNCVLQNSIDFPAMKCFINGGQRLSRGFKEGLMRAFRAPPLTLYGMSEANVIGYTTMGPHPAEHEARLEGKFYPKNNTEVRIANEVNEPVDIGVDGEIQVKTFSCMTKYKGMEERSKAMFTDDGFLKTGDVGVMFSDGRFMVKGRMVDAIRFKIVGKAIYPGPIEEVMSTHPAIADIAVVAASISDIYGDEVVYCIRLNAGIEKPTENDILTFAEEREMNEKHLPCRILYFDKFPTTTNARKISKGLLRDQVRRMIEDDSEVGMCQRYKDLLTANAK